MRYPRALTKEQIEYLLSNAKVGNVELGKKLGVHRLVIAKYKSRARKMGMDIPFSDPKIKKLDDDIKDIMNELKKIPKKT